MTEFSIEHTKKVSLEPISVGPNGDAYTEFTREKESIIRNERLDSQHPVVRIDLETIITQESGCGISIVVQDFGLPARAIDISGEFVSMSDVRGVARDAGHYSGAPKHLNLTANTPNRNKTFSLDDKDLPVDYEPVVISIGEAMLFVHDGSPSDERAGYIAGGFWDLIAQLPKDYYGAKDFSDVGTEVGRGYIPFIGISYEGSVLSIHSLDDVHAEVLYQQVRSLAYEAPTAPGIIIDEIDTDKLIAGLIAGSDGAKNAFKELLSKQRETRATIESLQAELLEAHNGSDSLETVLAGVKRKLSDARSEAARLNGEVKRLRQAAQSPPKSGDQSNSDFFSDLLGGRHTTQKDPHGHCASLGMDPEFLFSLNPEAAGKVIKGIHRGLAIQFHSDKRGGKTDDEPMKAVNMAVDSILSRLNSGYWGRH
jgi:hypothetical protein